METDQPTPAAKMLPNLPSVNNQVSAVADETALEAENVRLKAENEVLRADRETLKKTLGVLVDMG